MGRILFAVPETNPSVGTLNPDDFLTNHPVDSNLDTSTIDATNNAELTLRLKIFFEKVSTSDAGDTRIRANAGGWTDYADYNGNLFRIDNWPAADPGLFERFKREALWLINATWNGSMGNGHLWLKTPDNFAALDWPFQGTKTHRPNIFCRFHAWEVARQSDAHLKVRCVRLHNKALTTFDFSSDKHHWDSADIHLETNITPTVLGGATWFDANGKPVKHSHIPHEVGHALGLIHIGATVCQVMQPIGDLLGLNLCPSDQYMVGTDLGANIMGLGNLVQPVNAGPWMRHIVQHFPDDPSSPGDWVPFATRQFPRLLSSIPGATSAAAAAGS